MGGAGSVVCPGYKSVPSIGTREAVGTVKGGGHRADFSLQLTWLKGHHLQVHWVANVFVPCHCRCWQFPESGLVRWHYEAARVSVHAWAGLPVPLSCHLPAQLLGTWGDQPGLCELFHPDF